MTIGVTPQGKYQARLKEPNGGKYHRYTFETLEKAQRWHDLAQGSIRKGAPVPHPSALEGLTLQSLALTYGPSLWPTHRTSQVDSALGKLIEHLPEDPSAYTSRDILGFVEARRKEGVKDQTIRHNLSRLRKLLSHAEDMGDIPQGSLRDLKWPSLKGTESRYRFLTEPEEAALISGLSSEDHRDLAKFLIDTGFRPGEVVETDAYKAKPFEWRDVSKSKDGRTLVTLWETKTGSTRTVPLTKAAADILERRRELGERQPFSGLSYVPFKRDVKAAAEAEGMQDVVVYTFRHTCATRLVQRGADIRRVKDWMGHGNIETTMRYAKLVPEDIYGLADILE